MSHPPKVSVIISTYNRPALLERALESVYAQTFCDFEVLVIDDASPCVEEMQRLVTRWEARFAERNIEFWPYRIAENSGYQCYPKNRGIERASGDYIAYLDDDNEWMPHHLSALVAAIEMDFSTDMVYSRLHYVIEDEETRQRLLEKVGTAPEGDTIGTAWNPQKLIEKNYVDTSTMLHSKGAFWRMVREQGYGWDETARRYGDWNFVHRWALAGLNGRLVDVITVKYHWHKNSLQLTRPAIETPITFNYAQWLMTRKETDAATGYTGSAQTH